MDGEIDVEGEREIVESVELHSAEMKAEVTG